MIKFTPRVWTDEEKTILIRAHAEGKSNNEIYPLLPDRSQSSIDGKMEYLGLTRNRATNRVNWKFVAPQEKPARDKWRGDVKFEDVTSAEALVISRGAPRSAAFRVSRVPSYSMYGNPLAHMVA